jgi:hypothetical protein
MSDVCVANIVSMTLASSQQGFDQFEATRKYYSLRKQKNVQLPLFRFLNTFQDL